MTLKLIRVYTNSLDTADPERIVTTHHRLYRRHWYTLKVRAGTNAGAWGLAKHMTWSQKTSEPGVVEAWRISPRNELEKLRGGP